MATLSQGGAEVSSIWTMMLIVLSDFCMTERATRVGKCFGENVPIASSLLELVQETIPYIPPLLIPLCLPGERAASFIVL